MQFNEKLTSRFWNNGGKRNVRPKFGPFGLNLNPSFFSHQKKTLWPLFMDGFQLLWMDGVQIQPLGGGSLLFTIQFSEIRGTRFIDLERIKGWVNLEATQWLIIFPSYHPKQFKGKIMNKTWKNGKRPDSGPNFGAFAPNLVPKHIFVSFTSTSRYILFQANILRNLKKN